LFSKNLLFIKENEGFNELLIWTPDSFKIDLEKNLEGLNSHDKEFIPPRLQTV